MVHNFSISGSLRRHGSFPETLRDSSSSATSLGVASLILVPPWLIPCTPGPRFGALYSVNKHFALMITIMMDYNEDLAGKLSSTGVFHTPWCTMASFGAPLADGMPDRPTEAAGPDSVSSHAVFA